MRSKVAYALFLFFCLEAVSRFAVATLDPALILSGDSLWRIRWVRRHSGSAIGYGYPFSFDQYDATKGWSLKPGLKDLEVFEGKRLNTNSRGIRGEREYAYLKTAGLVRIVFLGDSFTFGEDVSDNETYVYLLQQMLAGTECINLGVHGWGHDQMLIYFKEEGLKYKPDIVVLGFVPHNMHRNLLSFRDYAKPRYALKKKTLVLKNSPVPRPEQILKNEVWRPKIFDLLRSVQLQIVRRLAGKEDLRAMPVTTAILEELVRASKEIGAQVLLVYLPSEGEMLKGSPGKEEIFLESFCSQAGIHYLGLRLPFLEKAAAGVGLKSLGHWGPNEHRIAAEAIREYIEGKLLTR